MEKEMTRESATCPECKYKYDAHYAVQRDDVKAILEGDPCTWCQVSKSENLTPVTMAAARTLEAMGL